MKSKYFRLLIAMMMMLMTFGIANAGTLQVSGAIFTTESICDGTNINIFTDKGDVYLDGGPAHPGAAGLPDGDYYVQVTEPNGTLLGKSNPDAPAQVVNGEFASCYQLSAILYTTSSGYTVHGYDTTSNAGGEYKVWASQDPSFPNSASKTDNFKVKENGTSQGTAQLHVLKFYDANANGINDDGQMLTGWKMNIHDNINIDRFTPVNLTVEADDYVITEYAPLQTNWFNSTPNPVNITLAEGDNETVYFGNYCQVASGGLTLGFWSNKNGQALITAHPNWLQALRDLNLRDSGGGNFEPTTAAQVKTWLLNATATNMAYMLSAQLAAMKLNVLNGNVSGNAYYIPYGGTINQLITAANTTLGQWGLTKSGHPARDYQETLKNYLDQLNNGAQVVPAAPCPYTFPE